MVNVSQPNNSHLARDHAPERERERERERESIKHENCQYTRQRYYHMEVMGNYFPTFEVHLKILASNLSYSTNLCIQT